MNCKSQDDGLVRSQYPNNGRIADRPKDHVRVLEGHGGHGYHQYRPVEYLFGDEQVMMGG